MTDKEELMYKVVAEIALMERVKPIYRTQHETEQLKLFERIRDCLAGGYTKPYRVG